MFCTQCRAELAEGSMFCSKCGAGQAAVFRTKETRSPFRTALLATAGVIGVLLVAAFVMHWSLMSRPANAVQAAAQPQTHEAVIANTAFTVNRLSCFYYKFQVPDATDISVEGHFAATGGAGNDIEVYLFDQDGFVNWLNRHDAAPYFSSGKLTEDKISATLPSQSGVYYFVFDNRFSLISPKAVQLNATLHYTN